MRRRLVGTYLMLVAFALVVFSVPVGISLAALLTANQDEVGLREARTVAVLLGTVRGSDADPATVRGATAALESLRGELEQQTGGRVELIDDRGLPALGRPVARPDEPALAATLQGQETLQRIDDSVLGEPGLEVTVPARSPAGTVVGGVRLTYPSAPVTDQIAGVWAFRVAVGLVALALAGVIAAWLARWMTGPLQSLDVMARRLSAGDFTARAQLTPSAPAEARRLGETLDSGARQLGTLVESQRAFVADASHQLRTPLTALRLTLDNLQDGSVDESARAATGRAVTEVVRMTRLVNDLLMLARAQGELAQPRRVDLAAVVADRLATWEPGAVERDVALLGDVEPGHHARVTPGHLEQVLDNLLDNALAVAPAGSTIRVSTAVDGPNLALCVTDAGPGMSDAARERAFDRFWRGRPGGTGLGLAIVRQLVEENGGTVTLHPATLHPATLHPARDGEGDGGGLAVRILLRR